MRFKTYTLQQYPGLKPRYLIIPPHMMSIISCFVSGNCMKVRYSYPCGSVLYHSASAVWSVDLGDNSTQLNADTIKREKQ